MGDLPFVHATVPAERRLPSGLIVPCDGPADLALDSDDQVICTGCRGPLVRVGDQNEGDGAP